MPPKCITDKLKFFQVASWAAEEIFIYRRENAEISTSAHGFDYGEVSEDKNIVTAVFSCLAISGRGKSILFISARKTKNEISISHGLAGAA